MKWTPSVCQSVHFQFKFCIFIKTHLSMHILFQFVIYVVRVFLLNLNRMNSILIFQLENSIETNDKFLNSIRLDFNLIIYVNLRGMNKIVNLKNEYELRIERKKINPNTTTFNK